MMDQPQNEDRRESGQPGGGQGRVDEVRGSGVYPASGPLPSGNPPIVTEAAWGQGERGPAGYYDHGSSELHLDEDEDEEGGDGIEYVEYETITEGTEVPQEQWKTFFDDFSRRHTGQTVFVEVGSFEEDADESQNHLIADGLPLNGVTASFKDAPEAVIQIMAGESTEDHVTHMIDSPKTVWHYEGDEMDEDDAVEIESQNGPSTLIHF